MHPVLKYDVCCPHNHTMCLATRIRAGTIPNRKPPVDWAASSWLKAIVMMQINYIIYIYISLQYMYTVYVYVHQMWHAPKNLSSLMLLWNGNKENVECSAVALVLQKTPPPKKKNFNLNQPCAKTIVCLCCQRDRPHFFLTHFCSWPVFSKCLRHLHPYGQLGRDRRRFLNLCGVCNRWWWKKCCKAPGGHQLTLIVTMSKCNKKNKLLTQSYVQSMLIIPMKHPATGCNVLNSILAKTAQSYDLWSSTNDCGPQYKNIRTQSDNVPVLLIIIS